MPGATEALAALRAAQVTVIFNSNRLAANAAGSEAALNGAGLGSASHDPDPARRTLWLKGDTPGGSTKDKRREAISVYYCVIAMAGDQLGDFSDLFNPDPARPDVVARRRDASSASIAARWGRGWFILSNPVYGTGIGGTRNEVFPDPRTRWLDPRGAPVE
jgi:predicted secreted acid phosphatase